MINKAVSVTDFGAIAGVTEFQSESIQKAIDHVFLAGGGEVLVPSGVYRVKGIRLRSGVTLHLLENAVLEGSQDPDDYNILQNDALEPVDADQLDDSTWERVGGAPEHFHKYASRWHNAVIRIYNAENVAIIGEKGSAIDGKNCYDARGEEFYRGPHGISIIGSHHIVLRGYTARNTGNWAQAIQNSSNILVENVVNEAGHDGVHLTTCEDVIVRHCKFYTGDDCVAGYNNKNILVEDCEINSACSAFRFSGTNVLIHHCHIFSPPKYLFRGRMSKEEKAAGIMSNDSEHYKDKSPFMLSVFTYYAELATDIHNLGTNITIRDCMIENADRFLHYNYSGNETWQQGKPLLDIKFENIKASGIAMPLTAYGDAEMPVSLTLENIEFSFRDGKEDTTFIHAANYKKIRIKNISLHGAKADHLIKSWDTDRKGEIEIINVKSDIPTDNLVVYTDEAFCCHAI